MAELVGHFLILALIIIGFLIVPLLVGRLVRPNLPTEEKDAIYECGEPTIGTSYIQFDLRFYVVALLFIIFDVEIAFFFPWAKIYGQATQLADTRLEETHIGAVLTPDDQTTRNSFSIRFNSAVSGTCSEAPKENRENKKLAITLQGLLPKEKGPYQIRFTSGALAGKMYRVARYHDSKKLVTLRESLPQIPKQGVEFVIDNYKKRVYAGKASQLYWTSGTNKGEHSSIVSYNAKTETLTLTEPLPNPVQKSDAFAIADPARLLLTEKILSQPPGSVSAEDAISASTGFKLAVVGFLDILVFFAVLLVGFAYVWMRGDLDWVRAVAERARQNSPVPPALANKK
ncbi:NADH ubiquinone oxidoreductase chain A [hydrothermal vent metagenome]|uniref:NADH ubiquinone oxidoreductase chain A n=1 Tax=hydrothermal vent metagenome TaxID=652676 RepID=A0A3B1E7K7_9ZZZZ